MSKRSLVAFFAAAAAMAGSVHASTLLFSDNFNNTAQSDDVNAPSAGRQGGTLAPLAYVSTDASTGSVQVGSTNNPGTLQLTSLSGNDGRVYINQDFSAIPTGGTLQIEFTVNPRATGTDPASSDGSWASITFGTDTTGANKFVNASDGIGILIRGNGGTQAFQGGGGLTSTNLLTAGSHLIDVDITASGTNDVINAYADGSSVPFFSFTTAAFAANHNYISFGGDSDGGGPAVVHTFANLAITQTPEPASFGLLGLGGLSLLRRRRA